MRWFDLVADDLYWRDLLDWLKSPFTLADRAGKANEIAAFEQAVRAAGALQGARAFRRAIGEVDAGEVGAGEVSAGGVGRGEVGTGEGVTRGARAGAREILALIETQVQVARRASARLAA